MSKRLSLSLARPSCPTLGLQGAETPQLFRREACLARGPSTLYGIPLKGGTSSNNFLQTMLMLTQRSGDGGGDLPLIVAPWSPLWPPSRILAARTPTAGPLLTPPAGADRILGIFEHPRPVLHVSDAPGAPPSLSVGPYRAAQGVQGRHCFLMGPIVPHFLTRTVRGFKYADGPCVSGQWCHFQKSSRGSMPPPSLSHTPSTFHPVIRGEGGLMFACLARAFYAGPQDRRTEVLRRLGWP